MNSILLLILSSVLLSRSLCDGSCSNVKACAAKCGGKSYDVSKLIDKKEISGPGYLYAFSCGGSTCNSKPNTAVCQEKDDGSGREVSVGLTSSVQWTITGNTPLQIQIQYSDGDPDDNTKILKSSSVSITVGNASAFDFIGEDSGTAIYSFKVSTPSTKDVYASSGVAPGIIGWVLIAVFLIGIAAYFIVGSILMVTVKGARGVEIIPNYMFWKSFPFLLRDGMLFMISPCYKRSQYQSI